MGATLNAMNRYIAYLGRQAGATGEPEAEFFLFARAARGHAD